MQLIRIGATGVRVKDVQILLNNVASANPRLVEDGIFGPKTQYAVVQFQQNSGLSADGIVGPLTARALIDAAAGCLK